MKIIYCDGGVLECNSIDVSADNKFLIADEIYGVPIAEVKKIVTD